MRTEEQLHHRIEAIKEVIVFASLLKLDSIAISNLKSFIKILEWVLETD